MKILWLSWKDINHPGAGGSEVVLHELAKRMVAEGNEVTILTALYPGASKEEMLDGIKVIRVGSNRYIQPFIALAYYIRHMRNRYDLVIDIVNTAPYFSPFFKGNAKAVLFYHQLAREIWYHEAPFPISAVGYYLLEPVATFLLGRSRATVITVSESTKADLLRFGFNAKRIHIISEGLHIEPIKDLEAIQKYDRPTLLSHGAMRTMKQTLDQIKAFEIAKESIPQLQLKISGSSSGEYGAKVLNYIQNSPHSSDIEYLGRTTDEQKIELMQRCHAIMVSSIKEGWGLIVSETNSQGTPAIVYDADGLRDSVKHMETGIVTAKNPSALAQGIVQLLSDQNLYQTLQTNAWQWSKQITFKKSYNDFKEAVA